MRLSCRHIILFAAILIPSAVAAQQAPHGSCLLPSGQWCWPVAPTTFGEVCFCEAATGRLQGVTQ